MSREQDVSSFGLLLRRYRLAAGLTQEGLADRAHLSVRAVSNLERGLNQRPRKDTLVLLAGALTLVPAEYSALEATARRPSIRRSAPEIAFTLPPLIGRAPELALLNHQLGGAGVPLLLLTGEPGIGKSRLLQEAAHQGRQRGWAVLEDGCRRGGQDPYAPLLGALKRHITGLSRNHLRALLQGCAWLVRVLPELVDGPIEPLPSWTIPAEQERRLLFEAVARFLSNIAGPAGTLVVLDDLQWAGADVLDLLTSLVRRAGGPPLRIVGAYRDTEVLPTDLLSVTLTDLAGAGLADRCRLAPLAREETEALLDRLLVSADRVGPTLREQIVRRAAGVPFFVVSCARGVLPGGGAGPVEDRVPWDLAQSIKQRVAALPAPAYEVLGVASVVGRAVPASLLIAASACSEQMVLAVLDGACRAQLLLEDGPGTYRFAHDVIREVVEGDLGTARRIALHRRVAETLEQDPDPSPVELLAYHFSRGEAHDKALLYLERAGDHARGQAAYAAAEGYYRDLTERLDRQGRVRDAALIGERRGAVLKTAARYEDALEVLERAAEMYRGTGDLEGRGRTTAQIGLLRGLTGAPDEGIRRLRPLLELLEPRGPSRAFAALLATFANLAACSDPSMQAQGLAAAERAIRIAVEVSDDRTRADAEISRATLLFLMGRSEAALRAWEDAIPLVEEVGDLSLLRAILNNVGVVYLLRGAIKRSHTYMQYALEVAERLGDPAEIAFQAGNHGSTTYHMGDWPGARLHLEKAVTLHRTLAANKTFDLYLMAYTNALLGLGQLCLAAGRWDEASGLLDEIVVIAQRSGDRLSLQNAARLHAEYDLQVGHPEEVPGYLIPVLDQADEEDMLMPWLRALLAWAQAQLGEFPTATDTVGLAVGTARARDHQFVLVDALYIQAVVAQHAGCRHEAAIAVEEGLTLAQNMSYPYAEGRLLHMCGQLHLTKGEANRAHTRLHAALDIFQRLGAAKDITATEQVLAGLDCLAHARS